MANDVSITTEEALKFVRNILCMSTTVEAIEKNHIGFVNEMIKEWVHHIPFQSIKAISTPHADRHLPTFHEIKEDLFSKRGGLCYDHGLGVYTVLRALGFDVTLISSYITFADRDNHVSVLVRNASSHGSIHMVDVGSIYPTLEAIPFDFESMSPEFHHSYLRYRFVREGDIIIRQHHTDTDPRSALWPECVKDKWFSCIYFEYTKPKDVSEIADMMARIYTDKMTHLITPRCMTCPRGRFVSIQSTTLLLENDEGCIVKTYLRSPDEFLSTHQKYFPQFSRETLKAVMADEWVHLDYSKNL